MNTIQGRDGSLLNVSDAGAAHVHRYEEPEMFAWTSVTADIDGNDTVILLQNDSTTKHLHITKTYAYTDVPSAVDFFAPAYAVITGTAITGVCLNRTAITTAPVTCLGDTTGDTLANIMATLYTNETAGDQHGVWLDFGGLLILGYHDIFAIALVAAPAVTNAAIFGYFHTNH